MSLPCPVSTCTRVMPGHLRVCRACTTRTLRDLADVPSLEVHLEIAITRQARIGEPGSGQQHAPDDDDVDPEIGLTVRRAPLPWDPRAREASDVLRSTLVGWHRVLSDGAPRVAGPVCLDCEHPSCEWADLGRPPADTLADVARWLIRHRVRLLRHPAVAEAVDELRAAIGNARRTIDQPPGTWYAGPCGATTEHGECAADLYACHGADRIRCRSCGTDHNAWARQAWLMEQAADHLGTATEIARALHGWVPDLTPAMIRGYAHRNRLLTKGRDTASRPLYRVGDVLALVTGKTNLLGPACATCRHATCREIRGDTIGTARSA